MKHSPFIRALLAAFIVLSFVAAPVRADEGMWPFNIVPRALIKERYGFEITDAWLKHVQLASVRFNNGGSGSFVAPDGLVLTNHHIASDTLTKLSTPAHDLLKEGFYARTRASSSRPNIRSHSSAATRTTSTTRATTSTWPSFASMKTANPSTPITISSSPRPARAQASWSSSPAIPARRSVSTPSRTWNFCVTLDCH